MAFLDELCAVCAIKCGAEGVKYLLFYLSEEEGQSAHLGPCKICGNFALFCFFRVVSQMSECCGWVAKLPCALHPY